MFVKSGNSSSVSSEEDFREKYLNKIVSIIEDENFVKEHCTDKAFTRKRKLSFIYLIVLITQGFARSIQRELNSFYKRIRNNDFSIQEVTKSAFTHARKKLDWKAFVKLNQAGIESFYKDAPYLTWNGYRLLGIDGSTVMLPNHPSIEKEFGVVGLGKNADRPRSMARISMLFDLLNLTTLDGQIDTYTASERDLARKHFEFIKPGKDLVIMDRGYPSIRLMYEMQQDKKDFCIRMKDNWWVEVKEMLENGEADKIVQFKIPAKDRDVLSEYNTTEDSINCRIVIVELDNGNKEALCTSILDNKKLPYELFSTLYHYRWNIEEGFKAYKSRVRLEEFSGKTALAIKQDFYAKIFMMTTAAVLAFPIEEKIKAEQEIEKTKKHTYKVNRTNALALTKEFIPTVFVKKIFASALRTLDNILRKTVEIVRPNRKNPRKKTKKNPPSMNYKQL